jgi:hypothetical protein
LTKPQSESSVFSNTNKTKALIISNDTNIPELNIRINDESVELVDNYKHLGVTLASDANWTVHIENIDPIFLNHYLYQFPLNKNVDQSMTMKCRQ